MKPTLNLEEVNGFALELDIASRNACAIPQLSGPHELGIDDAYRIQRAGIERRVRRGDQVIGVKMGFTSQSKMVQMGVSDQIIGRLTAGMQVSDGVAISLDRFIHPRCEPEVAFLLKRELSGNATLEEVRDAVGAIAPAIEIIDSRFKDFQFSLEDVIADNASAAAFILGAWRDTIDDFEGFDVELRIDGVVRQRGSSSDILGNPLNALVSAARLAGLQGTPLRAGDIVLAGAATQAEQIRPGASVQVRIAALGECSFSVMPPSGN